MFHTAISGKTPTSPTSKTFASDQTNDTAHTTTDILMPSKPTPPTPTTTTTHNHNNNSIKIANCFAMAPQDVWLQVIGPLLSARDIVSLSMVCNWANEMAHEIRTHHSTYNLTDNTEDLRQLREVLLSWPHLCISFTFARTMERVGGALQMRKLLAVAGRAKILTMSGCDVVEFDFVSKRLANLTLHGLKLDHSGCDSLGNCLVANNTLTNFTIIACEFADKGIGLCESFHTNAAVVNFSISESVFSAESLAGMIAINSSIHTLSLEGNDFGVEGRILICEALNSNSHITFLNMGYNSFGSEGANSLGDLLLENSVITTLAIHKNGLFDAGAKCVSEALGANKSLTSLSLAGNILWAESGKHLRSPLSLNSTLTELDLSNNSLGPEGVQHICEALALNSVLTSLDLKSNNIGPEGCGPISSMLLTNSAITNLELSFNHIQVEGALVVARAVGKSNILARLGMGWNDLGDEGGRHFSEAAHKCKSLHELDLSGNGTHPSIIQDVQLCLHTRRPCV